MRPCGGEHRSTFSSRKAMPSPCRDGECGSAFGMRKAMPLPPPQWVRVKGNDSASVCGLQAGNHDRSLHRNGLNWSMRVDGGVPLLCEAGDQRDLVFGVVVWRYVSSRDILSRHQRMADRSSLRVVGMGGIARPPWLMTHPCGRRGCRTSETT